MINWKTHVGFYLGFFFWIGNWYQLMKAWPNPPVFFTLKILWVKNAELAETFPTAKTLNLYFISNSSNKIKNIHKMLQCSLSYTNLPCPRPPSLPLLISNDYMVGFIQFLLLLYFWLYFFSLISLVCSPSLLYILLPMIPLFLFIAIYLPILILLLYPLVI